MPLACFFKLFWLFPCLFFGSRLSAIRWPEDAWLYGFQRLKVSASKDNVKNDKCICHNREQISLGVLARAALGAAGKDIINLGIGQPDFRTPDRIVEAGIKALQDGAHGYTPQWG